MAAPRPRIRSLPPRIMPAHNPDLLLYLLLLPVPFSPQSVPGVRIPPLSRGAPVGSYDTVCGGLGRSCREPPVQRPPPPHRGRPPPLRRHCPVARALFSREGPPHLPLVWREAPPILPPVAQPVPQARPLPVLRRLASPAAAPTGAAPNGAAGPRRAPPSRGRTGTPRSWQSPSRGRRSPGQRTIPRAAARDQRLETAGGPHAAALPAAANGRGRRWQLARDVLPRVKRLRTAIPGLLAVEVLVRAAVPDVLREPPPAPPIGVLKRAQRPSARAFFRPFCFSIAMICFQKSFDTCWIRSGSSSL